MEVLRAAIERSAAEQVGTLVVVEADEGFGKTALLTAIVEEVSSSATVLSTRSREDHAAPYVPWVEVLDQLGATEVRSLLDGWTDQNQTGEWRRNQLFHGVGANIAQAAAGRPVVLLLDDAHWADEGTTRLLLHVLAETSAERVTTIIAWRPREVKVGVPAVALAEHVAKRRGPRVALGVLDETDIGTLLERQRGDAAPAAADLPKRIFEVTSGVPLFVEDVITSAAADDRPLDGDIAQIPETARSITVRRLTGAGEVATEVAKAASLLAEPISLDVLPDLVPELSVEVVLDGVDRLVEYGLLRETPAGPTFVHATFRSAVATPSPRDAAWCSTPTPSTASRSSPCPRPPWPSTPRTEGGSCPRPTPPPPSTAPVERPATAVRSSTPPASSSARWRWRPSRCAPQPCSTTPTRLAGRRPGHRQGRGQLGRRPAGGPARPGARRRAGPRRGAPRHDRGRVRARSLVDRARLRRLGALVHPTARGRCAVALAYHQAAWGAPSTVVEAALTQARQELPDPCPDDLMDEVVFTDGLANLRSPDLDDRRDHAHLLADRGRARQDLRSVGRGLRLLCMAHLSAGDLESVEEDATELETVAIRTGSWMYQSDVLRCRSAVALARNDLDGLRGCIAELDRLAADPLAGWVFVGTQRLLLSHAEGDLTTALHFVDAVRTALPPQGAWQTDRMLADLYRIRLLFEMGEPDQARGELDELAPWKELHLSCCRRYPSELALMSTAVASVGRADVAAQLLPLVEPFRGQQVVLGWGEGLIGSFEDCWRSLDVLAGAGAGAGTVEPDARPADQPLV
ncbi:AAA family ATPase [Aquihabitans sp. McL0605]|uniref:AAA family ATPase n=1 Tax=Aquihabitans sp. McL0605 TaxID=3415671 RepID=UPI003CF4B022